MTDDDLVVRVCMTCDYCPWAAIHAGPAREVAEFLHALALAHVLAVHPERLPAGDVDDLVLRDLGCSLASHIFLKGIHDN